MKTFLINSKACSHVLLGLLVSLGAFTVNAQTQTSFASAEEAVNALMVAIEKNDVPALGALLGSGSEDILSSGDEVADKTGRDSFLELYKAKHSLVAENDTTMILQVGENEWPLPIPVVKQDGKWLLDGAAGAEEIVYRRIGRNELGAIAFCNGFLDAQAEYASEGRDGNAPGIYATKLLSEPGKHDGLYWKTAEGEPASPAGDAVANATEEGYRAASGGSRTPYHGYYYRMLFAQGANAPGGALDYFAAGELTQGIALLAWPAEYGVSGVSSFMVSHDGVIYEKDLGENSSDEAEKIQKFDPDKTWTAVGVPQNP
jgi:hypothetical protein